MSKNLHSKGCLKCGGDTTVKDSRPTAAGDTLRRRECNDCGYRYSTLEIPYGPHERCREIAQWAAEQNREIFSDGQ